MLKHLVPIYFSFTKGKSDLNGFISAFVIDTNGTWLLITAGHNLEQIEINIASGYAISSCRIVDSLNLGASDINPIPFEYREEETFRISSDSGMDYGVIAIPELCQEAMRRNGVEALPENAWATQPRDVDYYMLLGTPDGLTRISESGAMLTAQLLLVEPLDYRPPIFKDKTAPMFYGRVNLTENMDGIIGMSGGPVFSFRQLDGTLDYGLHAIQSTWDPDTREIAACLMGPLAHQIKTAMDYAIKMLPKHSE